MFQIPLGIFGQFYAMSALIGCGFVFGSAMMGMLDDSSGGDGDGSDTSDGGDGPDAGAGGDDGPDAGAGSDDGPDSGVNVSGKNAVSASRLMPANGRAYFSDTRSSWFRAIGAWNSQPDVRGYVLRILRIGWASRRLHRAVAWILFPSFPPW